MAHRELEELLEKADDIRRVIAELLKGDLDLKKVRQTGPAKGQTYWFAHIDYADSYTYTVGYFDLDICKYTRIYPEERFAEAELRARKLIQAVNRRRRELNEGKEFEDHRCYIVCWTVSGLDFCEGSTQASAPGFAYPFGLFKNSVDCVTCIDEFEDELEWFYTDYLPLMAELDDYDWAEAPGWRE